MIRGARPIVAADVAAHYEKFIYQPTKLIEYTNTWRDWLLQSSSKQITGLALFDYADYTCGTSQAFDHFWLRYSNKRLVCFAGEFQYHSCIGKHLNFKTITQWSDLQPGDALILSFPFSDIGSTHPQQHQILSQCNNLSIPVCLDLAYWGISKNISIDLTLYPCVQEVSSSLSKSFYTLENHRVGVRFTKKYTNDGISMINEVNMQNNYSMSLGVHYMTKFSADWNWQQFGDAQLAVCKHHDFAPSDTVIFGLTSDSQYGDFNRGIPNNNRICISNLIPQLYNTEGKI
jgi:hypothetical protein